MRTLTLGILLASAPAGAVEVDLATYGGHTYAFVNERHTWEDADALCRSAGFYLVRVDDLDELRFLMRNIHGGPRYLDGNDTWLGGSRVGPYAGALLPGLTLTWPWDGTLDSAFWLGPSEFTAHKAVCERS